MTGPRAIGGRAEYGVEVTGTWQREVERTNDGRGQGELLNRSEGTGQSGRPECGSGRSGLSPDAGQGRDLVYQFEPEGAEAADANRSPATHQRS